MPNDGKLKEDLFCRAGDSTIREIDDNLHQLQQLLQLKDKEIQRLNRKLAEKTKNPQKSDKCEHESIVIG